MNLINRQWCIAGNPAGRALRKDDFNLMEVPSANLMDGQVRVKTDYLEFTPSLKGQMENRLSYAAKTKLGQVMRGRGIGRVVESRSSKFAIGDIAYGYLGWQDYAALPAAELSNIPDDDYARLHLGPLGSSGMAAYFGLFNAGKPKSGDTVIISGAAGAVGSMVGQMAKIAGCRVIGTAGGAVKRVHLLDKLKLDGAIDYKNETLGSAMKKLAPNGFDVVFDNVGGEFLQAALGNLAVGARIVICGAITRYEMDNPAPGPSNYFQLVHKRATMQGILSPDYKDQFPTATAEIRTWIESGDFKYFEDIQEGFEYAPDAFMRLFSGKNIGKQLLKL